MYPLAKAVEWRDKTLQSCNQSDENAIDQAQHPQQHPHGDDHGQPYQQAGNKEFLDAFFCGHGVWCGLAALLEEGALGGWRVGAGSAGRSRRFGGCFAVAGSVADAGVAAFEIGGIPA